MLNPKSQIHRRHPQSHKSQALNLPVPDLADRPNVTVLQADDALWLVGMQNLKVIQFVFAMTIVTIMILRIMTMTTWRMMMMVMMRIHNVADFLTGASLPLFSFLRQDKV